jgi:transcriptional regulator with XRE-family HTH domain
MVFLGGIFMSVVIEQENLEILGRRLQEVRELRQMSALRLAAEMESSLTSIRDWENGARKLQPATIRAWQKPLTQLSRRIVLARIVSTGTRLQASNH